MKKLKTHPVHGINASALHCFICTDYIKMVFFGEAVDESMPFKFSNPMIYCDNCKDQIDHDIRFIIEVKNGWETRNKNLSADAITLGEVLLPERTGNVFLITREQMIDRTGNDDHDYMIMDQYHARKYISGA